MHHKYDLWTKVRPFDLKTMYDPSNTVTSVGVILGTVTQE